MRPTIQPPPLLDFHLLDPYPRHHHERAKYQRPRGYPYNRKHLKSPKLLSKAACPISLFLHRAHIGKFLLTPFPSPLPPDQCRCFSDVPSAVWHMPSPLGSDKLPSALSVVPSFVLLSLRSHDRETCDLSSLLAPQLCYQEDISSGNVRLQ